MGDVSGDDDSAGSCRIHFQKPAAQSTGSQGDTQYGLWLQERSQMVFGTVHIQPWEHRLSEHGDLQRKE